MLFETNKGGVKVPPINKTFRDIAQSQRMTQDIISQSWRLRKQSLQFSIRSPQLSKNNCRTNKNSLMTNSMFKVIEHFFLQETPWEIMNAEKSSTFH